MENQIKEIVATFTKTPVEQIGPSTPIGRTAVKSSILLHRMFAKLAEAGLRVDNYAGIRVFGDLPLGGPAPFAAPQATPPSSTASAASGPGTVGVGVGIDIEEIASMPKTQDFRTEEFYTMNFTAAEIAYCILQPDPYASFAGLFAAKEAIVKADGTFRTYPFSAIAIGHSAEGRPVHPGWDLSISHAGGMAAAVAVPGKKETPVATATPSAVPQVHGGAGWTAWLALLLSAAAIIIHYIR